MVKQVTCSVGTIRRTASAQGISLAVDGWYQDGDQGKVDNGTPDVHAMTMPGGAVAVRGHTLAGDLFLSLLVAGVLG
jgi:hypothetical protein